MLLAGDLVFSSLVLVVSFVVPLIGFFVRRKWQLYVARQAEIKKLLVLASEEAAMAELEASVGYGTVPISRNYHHCAVCYCSTTTRCARCKAVRYWYVNLFISGYFFVFENYGVFFFEEFEHLV